MSSGEQKLWFVVLAAPAQKALRRIPSTDRVRILNAIEQMNYDPLLGDVRKLHGGLEGFRRRVGNRRIFFDVYPNERRVVVTAIKRRTSTTY
jgi:mRNA-degrading endonuclease RelE of RelBE toxin-antitoxin system